MKAWIWGALGALHRLANTPRPPGAESENVFFHAYNRSLSFLIQRLKFFLTFYALEISTGKVIEVFLDPREWQGVSPSVVLHDDGAEWILPTLGKLCSRKPLVNETGGIDEEAWRGAVQILDAPAAMEFDEGVGSVKRG